jgi:hypothetical protein
MDWLLILAINFTDGGYEKTHTPVPTKAACELVLKVSLAATGQIATAPFVWRATCIDLKNAKVDHPSSAEIPGTAPPETPPVGEGPKVRS